MRITTRASIRLTAAILMGVAAAIFASGLEHLQPLWQNAIGLNYIIYGSSDPPTWPEYLCIITLRGIPTAVFTSFVALLVYHYSFKPRPVIALPLPPDQMYPRVADQYRVGNGEKSIIRIICSDLYRVSSAGMTVVMLVVGLLWGASFLWSIRVTTPPILISGHRMVLSLSRGLTYVHCIEYSREPGIEIQPYSSNHITNSMSAQLRFSAWSSFHWWHIPRGWSMVIPTWSLFIALPIWPTIAAVMWILARTKPGHCIACNYDLRGSKASTSCPECGEAIPRPAAQDAGG